MGYNRSGRLAWFLPRVRWCLPLITSASCVNSLDYRFATVQGQRVEWSLRQNCAMSPSQIGIIYLSLIAISLVIGSFFWAMGATLVLPFCLLELLVLGVCFLCFARRALDRERICIEGAQVTVECELSGVLHKAAFQREWLRVELPRRAQSLIELRGQGQVVVVGRFVRPEWRSALAAEIKRAARTA